MKLRAGADWEVFPHGQVAEEPTPFKHLYLAPADDGTMVAFSVG
jgi:hypothetical protein